MSVLENREINRATMSPLDDVGSPTSVSSELMVTDMLDDHDSAMNDHHHHQHHHHHQEQHHHHQIRDGNKRKRNNTDGEELSPRKVPSLSSNNNDVGYVLEESGDDALHDDGDDVSCAIDSLFIFHFLLSISFQVTRWQAQRWLVNRLRLDPVGCWWLKIWPTKITLNTKSSIFMH